MKRYAIGQELDFQDFAEPVVFETLEEATAFANDYFNETGIILAVQETDMEVTHVYDFKEKEP